jgi:hypothetical protein
MRLPLGLCVLLASTQAIAQTRLGELLDAGAKRLSAEEFRQQIVQRPLQARLDSGMSAELLFASNGSLEGAGSGGPYSYAAEWAVQVRGTWAFGDDGTVCTTVMLEGPTIRANFPRRCRYWFRLGNRYYVADSASDRSARILSRTLRG